MPNENVRLTVTGQANYQIPKTNPTTVTLGFERKMKNAEEPYERSPRKALGREWQPIDQGWVKTDGFTAGLIILKNLSADKTIEYGYGHRDPDDDKPSFFVPPGEGVLITPSHPDELYFRCRDGEARYQIMVVAQ